MREDLEDFETLFLMNDLISNIIIQDYDILVLLLNDENYMTTFGILEYMPNKA